MREKKRKEKKTELEKPTGIAQIIPSNKRMKEEGKKRLRQLFFYITVRVDMK